MPETTRPLGTGEPEVGAMSQPPMDDILTDACRAPSVHNTQPWQWRVSGAEVRLHTDDRRRLDVLDPDGRDLVISCGAALHHLQVAAAGHGWNARVTRLASEAGDGALAVAILRPARIAREHARLLEALRRRRTDRRRLTSWPVPVERLKRLAADGTSWGAMVLPVESERTRATLEHLTFRANRIQQQDERYAGELAAWVRADASDGIPVDHVVAGQRSDVTQLDRVFPGGVLDDPVLEREASVDGMLIVCTSSDDRLSRLRAGEALSAVWLAATTDGLALVPLTSAMEVDETRRQLQADVLDDLAFPQLLMRVGWPPMSRSPLPPTPRLPLAKTVVRTEGPSWRAVDGQSRS